ncbi:ATP-binding protein [Luteimonas sp. 22616]|uniref:ATP-binding protein n=1 Tax=Luteimonas sp. 22616 TaxID=3453951 RepID=UPI003F849541
MPAIDTPNSTPPGWALLPEVTRLLLAVVLPLLALAALILWWGTTTARMGTPVRLDTAAESSGHEIDNFLRSHQAILQVLAERRSATGDIDDRAAWSADLSRIHDRYPAFATLLVGGPDGRLLLTEPVLPGPAAGRSIVDRDYFREPRRSGMAYVSNVFGGGAMDRPALVAISAPLYRDGRFAGVVVGVIGIDALSSRAMTLRERGYELLLLDRSHAVVQASEGLPYRPLDVLGDDGRDHSLLVLPQVRGHERMQRLPDVLRDGSDAYALAVPLQVGWQLVLLRPERLISAEPMRGAALLLGLLALVLLGILAVVGIKMRKLGRSVHGLLERMQLFALDRTPTQIPVDTLPRELAPVAEAMNELAARARLAYDDISSGLHEQSRLREELQAMAQRLLTAQEDERRTLSRELHDDIGQAITAIKLGATALLDDDPARREIIDEIVAVADQTVVKLRNLSLLLRPPQLDSLGLEAALRGQVALLARNARTRITLQVSPLPQRPPPALELAAFRIAQEALTNAMRHANASEIDVSIEVDEQALRLHVNDDGNGFDPDQVRGLGLLTMRERVQQLGGTLVIDTSPGAGTRICASLPMPAAE